MEELPRVGDCYRNGRVLVTGGSGFLGKLLIEKLLHSCPELDRVYLVLRPSRQGISPQDRWNQIIKEPIFDRLKRERGPRLLEEKIQVLEGDTGMSSLGLSSGDLALVQESVSHVFHVAATVRFNDPLPRAVLINTRGTLELLNIALGFKNIKAFVYVSTTFINSCCPDEATEERVYPPKDDWRNMLAAVEALPHSQIAVLQKKIIENHPNTYTYSKQLAESIVYHYKDRLPVIIMRPSIVLGCKSEPEPGWVDNLNGPVGLIAAGAKGLLRVGFLDSQSIWIQQPFICADETVQAILQGPRYLALYGRSGDVFNLTAPNTALTYYNYMRIGSFVMKYNPSRDVFWQYMDMKNFYCASTFRIQAVLFHFIPAVIVDALFRFFKQKPVNLLKTHIKLHNVLQALWLFPNKSWKFPNTNYVKLCKAIHPLDLDDFGSFDSKPDFLSYITCNWRLQLKHIFKEDIDKKGHFHEATKKQNRLYWLDKLLKTSFYCLLGYALHRFTDISNCFGINLMQ